MRALRIAFAGTPVAAVPALEALIASAHEVVTVITRPDAPSGRGRALRRSPVGAIADAEGIEVLTPVKTGDQSFLDQLAARDLDACAVVAYGNLLPQRTLDLPRLGWINLHFSLLPRWRGAAPVQHAIWAGDQRTGVSTFLLERGMDTGPTYSVEPTAIGSQETAGELLERLAISGARVLVRTFDDLAAGTAIATAQPLEGATLAPKLSTEAAQIDFTCPAEQIDRLVRSCTPAPGAWSTLQGIRVKLGPVHITDIPELEPGHVQVHKQRILVGTGTVAVQLGEVQPQGKKSMAAPDFARGVRLETGARFELVAP